MKPLYFCIFSFACICPLISSAVPLGLRIQALRGNAEAQFQMGLEVDNTTAVLLSTGQTQHHMRYYSKSPLKSKKFYLKAVKQKHAGAANRLAVLLEKEGKISEAIEYHERAVEWDRDRRFSPGYNPSKSIGFDFILFKIPSPGTASAFELARIYRGRNNQVPIDISKSNTWYTQAHHLGVPAVLIGASLIEEFSSDPENVKSAIEWFEIALKESAFIPYVHYKMGNAHMDTGEYSKAVDSYINATKTNTETTAGFRFRVRAALKLGRLHSDQSFSQGQIPVNNELSQYFYEQAFRAGKQAQDSTPLTTEEYPNYEKQAREFLRDDDYVATTMDNWREAFFADITAVPQIVEDYFNVYKKHRNENDLNLALYWLKRVEEYQKPSLQKTIFDALESMPIAEDLISGPSTESCRENWIAEH